MEDAQGHKDYISAPARWILCSLWGPSTEQGSDALKTPSESCWCRECTRSWGRLTGERARKAEGASKRSNEQAR